VLLNVPNVVQVEHAIPVSPTIIRILLAKLAPPANMFLLVNLPLLTVSLVDRDVLHVRLMEPAKHVIPAVI